jgi:hypothetical protein
MWPASKERKVSVSRRRLQRAIDDLLSKSPHDVDASHRTEALQEREWMQAQLTRRGSGEAIR